MRNPIKRRHLGDYVIRVWDRDKKAHVDQRVAVYVNAEELAFQLGDKAVGNKSKRSKIANGAVLVEAL